MYHIYLLMGTGYYYIFAVYDTVLIRENNGLKDLFEFEF